MNSLGAIPDRKRNVVTGFISCQLFIASSSIPALISPMQETILFVKKKLSPNTIFISYHQFLSLTSFPQAKKYQLVFRTVYRLTRTTRLVISLNLVIEGNKSIVDSVHVFPVLITLKSQANHKVESWCKKEKDFPVLAVIFTKPELKG